MLAVRVKRVEETEVRDEEDSFICKGKVPFREASLEVEHERAMGF